MRIRVTKGYKSLHIRLIEPIKYQDLEGKNYIYDSIKEIVLLQKDEKWRRQNCMLCIGLLKIYFPEIKELMKYKDECTFDDRGFFETFPYEIIGKVREIQGKDSV